MSTPVMIADRMTIGELSRRTGASVKALREYTDLGLIYTLGRSPVGYRLYDIDALWCVRFINELRGLGLTIAEIQRLAAAKDSRAEQHVSSHLTELLHHSQQRLHQRIAEAHQILNRIEMFKTVHRQHLADGDLCWAGDPHSCRVRT